MRSRYDTGVEFYAQAVLVFLDGLAREAAQLGEISQRVAIDLLKAVSGYYIWRARAIRRALERSMRAPLAVPVAPLVACIVNGPTELTYTPAGWVPTPEVTTPAMPAGWDYVETWVPADDSAPRNVPRCDRCGRHGLGMSRSDAGMFCRQCSEWISTHSAALKAAAQVYSDADIAGMSRKALQAAVKIHRAVLPAEVKGNSPSDVIRAALALVLA